MSEQTRRGAPAAPSQRSGGTPGEPASQPVAERVANRSHRPASEAFRTFIASSWSPVSQVPETGAVAPFARERRHLIGAHFPGDRLVIPAGPLVTRSNDTDYRFRPHSAFAHLSGLGADREPDAVLVLDPHPSPLTTNVSHDAVLYFRPRAERDTQEFYANARYGELWVGARPSLADLESQTGIACAHIDDLPAALAAPARGADAAHRGVPLRVVTGADRAVEELVATVRARNDAAADAAAEPTAPEGASTPGPPHAAADAALVEALSELRLVKDPYEIDQLRLAVAATVAGFEDIVRALPRATTHARGERVIEGAFSARAREEGNGVGYETIAAAGDHACTLHWIRNDGPVAAGQLVLVDAGVEVESLYTADVTRTLPVDGVFSAAQRTVYQAVLDAADAAFAVVRPGARLRDVHDAAMAVIAARLEEWGWLPVSAKESLAPQGQFHRRWMVHGTSHHLGIDVHDCAQARRETYLDGALAPGMVFTIEPGLYLKADDLAVPAQYRGIGVRIEDDVLVTTGGVENLSAALPRTPDEVEAWMAGLLPR